MCLTGRTVEDDLELVAKYRQYIDLVELRVDFLSEDERLRIRDFPRLARIPCILTIRRVCDGGRFSEGEGTRTALFARALAFAEQDTRKNFAYVDFEEDFRVPSLEDAAVAFGTKIIRSFHDMNGPVTNIADRLNRLRTTGYEIPKIAFMPRSLSDVSVLFTEAQRLRGSEQILCAMGDFGLPSRILSAKLNSYLSYTSPAELIGNLSSIGHCDPVTLETMYRFRSISEHTRVFGITGWPLKVTSSPAIHNDKMKRLLLDSVYIPFRSETAREAYEFAKAAGMVGYSVTVPHKETIIEFLDWVDDRVRDIGACNTVVREGSVWRGYNTDCSGFSRSLVEFVQRATGRGVHGKKAAVIGAGGASRAIVYALKELGADVCVFNRTSMKARKLAEKFGFAWAGLGADSIPKLSEYSELIVQTTSKGMGETGEPDETNDPLWFYEFTGQELVYDVIYEPKDTPILRRAQAAGCRTSNGWSMLLYQAISQIELFMRAYTDSTEPRERAAITRMVNVLLHSMGLG